MLDALTSLAFSVHSSKGVYALLLGSGLSSAAGIPTGWDITLDLIRKSAAASNEDCSDDPAAWYKTKTGREADYSDLLDVLAKTPSDRANLLSSYFDPSPDELAKGLRAPTAAHKVIGRLAAKGYFRVIVTTNFDRLVERALEAEGVSPTVISTVDAARGALPLVHARCTVIKVHGDYRDTRIRNTSSELASYEEEMNALLDRVFDEYGLIVCGWSATWDKALCQAIMRCRNRRFSTYWIRRQNLSSEAKSLVSQRQAVEFQSDSADSFFAALEMKLDAIERYSEPHPLSAKLAVASLKKFIADDGSQIQLRDLLAAETERAYGLFAPLQMGGHSLTNENVLERMKVYENGCGTLLALFAQGGFWSKPQHYRLWSGFISRIADLPRGGGGAYSDLLKLRMYPTCLLFYSVGLTAIAGQTYGLLAHLCREAAVRQDGEERPLHRILPWSLLELGTARQLPGYVNHYTPVNDRIFDVLREPLREYLASDAEYEDAFDRFEYLVALIQFDIRMGPTTVLSQESTAWAPVGRFGWRSRIAKSIDERLLEEAERNGSSAIFQSGLFSSLDRFRVVQQAFRERILSQARSQWY